MTDIVHPYMDRVRNERHAQFMQRLRKTVVRMLASGILVGATYLSVNARLDSIKEKESSTRLEQRVDASVEKFRYPKEFIDDYHVLAKNGFHAETTQSMFGAESDLDFNAVSSKGAHSVAQVTDVGAEDVVRLRREYRLGHLDPFYAHAYQASSVLLKKYDTRYNYDAIKDFKRLMHHDAIANHKIGSSIWAFDETDMRLLCKELHMQYSPDMTVALYNWGPRVRHALTKYTSDWKKHLPKETKNHILTTDAYRVSLGKHKKLAVKVPSAKPL